MASHCFGQIVTCSFLAAVCFVVPHQSQDHHMWALHSVDSFLSLQQSLHTCPARHTSSHSIMCLFQANVTTSEMAVFVWGLVGIVVFYIVMLGVGIWAGTKQKSQSEEEVLLAGRNLGTVVGFLTLIGASVCCCLTSLLISLYNQHHHRRCDHHHHHNNNNRVTTTTTTTIV